MSDYDMFRSYAEQLMERPPDGVLTTDLDTQRRVAQAQVFATLALAEASRNSGGHCSDCCQWRN